MLNHIDQNNLPTMVDVSDKVSTIRLAKAQSLIRLSEEFKPYIKDGDIFTKKGSVFQTAIIAGTMAVKKTYEMIPFCHQIPIESCKFEIKLVNGLDVQINCIVKTFGKTGVEMEAMHGANIAALTIYDMGKALSHNMEILSTKLISKVGGKRTILDKPIYGLVLTGGKSKRMQKDKALIEYYGKPHAKYIYEILDKFCDKTYLSAKKGQWDETSLSDLPKIYDQKEDDGPIYGILNALKTKSDAYWLIVACDLIYFNDQTVQTLLSNIDSTKDVVAFTNKEKGFAEPLCTLYGPDAIYIFEEALKLNIKCPVKALKQAEVNKLEQSEHINLANINTINEYEEVSGASPN